MLKFNN